MSMEWFRWYHGTVSNPKLAFIAKKSGQSRPVTIAVWAALLEQASKSDIRGDVSNFDVETIAVALDIEEDAINAVIAAMPQESAIYLHESKALLDLTLTQMNRWTGKEEGL